MSIPHVKIPGRILLGDPSPGPVFHDTNTYCYKLVNGKQVLKGIILAVGWETRPCGRLSCYKPIGQEAVEIAEFRKPRLDKNELTSKAKAILEADSKRTITSVAEELDVPLSTLHSWLTGRRQSGKPSRNAPREKPDRDDLLKVFLAGDMKVDPVRKHYGCAWNKAKEWLMEEGIVDMKNNMIADVAGLDAGTKEQLKAKVEESIEEPEEVNEEVIQYEPADNDDVFESEESAPYTIAKPEFDHQAYALELIANIVELADLRQAPAELTVELINAVLVVV